MKIEIEGLRQFKPWGNAVKVYEKIELANKLEEAEAILAPDGETLPGSYVNDALSGYLEGLDILAELGLDSEPVIESVANLNKRLEKLINEDLDNDVCYNFVIQKVSDDELKLTSGESEYSVYINPNDDLQDIEYAIEDFVDGELASDEDDSENITGTEVVGFNYNKETGKGAFDAYIFFEEN